MWEVSPEDGENRRCRLLPRVDSEAPARIKTFDKASGVRRQPGRVTPSRLWSHTRCLLARFTLQFNFHRQHYEGFNHGSLFKITPCSFFPLQLSALVYGSLNNIQVFFETNLCIIF